MMRRGIGKARRLTGCNNEDAGSEEEEMIPAQKKRGRPQKVLKDEIDRGECGKVNKNEGDYGKFGVSSIDTKGASGEIKTERKKSSTFKARLDSAKVEEEKGTEEKSSYEEPIKLNGFRHNGSRRKSTPRRAAEVGVKCR